MRRQGAGPGSQVRNLIGGGGATMGGGAEDAEQEARLAKQRQYRLELEQQAIEKQERKRREKAEREALDRKHEECVAPAARCATRRRNISTPIPPRAGRLPSTMGLASASSAGLCPAKHRRRPSRHRQHARAGRKRPTS